MGKHGPCYHCGVTSTPLWRNGPPDKPVLCNACGSRWRTKGTLENYTPLHARGETDEIEDHRVSRAKTFSYKNKEPKVLKRKYDSNVNEFGGVLLPDYNNNQGFRRAFDEDISNRSSSGSAISNSESCAQYGSADASDLTGPSPSKPVVWDSTVPSRKRTCFTRPKPSPVEKLTKDLYTIWHEQQSSCMSVTSEDDLLLESDKPMVSVEIGHGSVLIRHPSSIAREEESEASSLSIDNKKHAPSSQHVPMPSLVEEKCTNLSRTGIEKIPKPSNKGTTEQERNRRDKDQPQKLQILAHHNSPLGHIDLQEIVNLDKLVTYFTNDEQQRLLKLLPSVDTSKALDSLRSMFDSSQFKENLSSFQKLLADGLFDNTLSGLTTEDCRAVRKLVLCNSSKSKWVEQYKIFKETKGSKSAINEPEAVKSNALATADYSLSVTRPRDGGAHQKFSGAKAIIKSPKKTAMRSICNEGVKIDKGCSFLSPKSLFSSDFVDESCEQDLLLDVPSNGMFPQAELLPSYSFGAQASTTSSTSLYPYFGNP
ncbi:GATA transcription factor 26 [Striga hermonthica]|uniref:GATA transcription factor 26 n=1 Tax=Striga hermonthica TaxID=68872 RepID=A0A9N7NVZ5_STRHE|nr:GATA transcription factor 26 [Striga hermonthica]